MLGDTGGQGEGSPEFRELLTPKMAACKDVAPPCVDTLHYGDRCEGCSSGPKQNLDSRLGLAVLPIQDVALVVIGLAS